MGRRIIPRQQVTKEEEFEQNNQKIRPVALSRLAASTCRPGVILFHTLVPFDELIPWGIKNAERSAPATLFSVFFTPWGMPFFFLMAGVTSWFSLRRRTPGRYARERVTQLLIPFIIGAIVLTPIVAYYELTHSGCWKGALHTSIGSV